MADKSYTFNFHEEERDSFLQYLYISLIADGDFNSIMEATDGGKSITLSVYANGIELNAQKLMEGLERNFTSTTEGLALTYIKSAELPYLEEALRAAERAIRDEMKQRLEALGISFKAENEEW